MRSPFVLSISLAAALMSPATAQNDTCTNPVSFIYVGDHGFTTAGLTTSGFELGGDCDLGPGQAIYADGFVQWYVPFAGDFQFDTNATSWDTRLAIYDGTDCNAICLGSDDDSGIGSSSLVRVPGLAGNQIVMIQIGGAQNQQGEGVLTITPYETPCIPSSEDSLEDNDDCNSAVPMEAGTFPGRFASRSDPDFYALCVPAGGQLHAEAQFVHNFGNLDLKLWMADSFLCGSNQPGASWLAAAESDNDSEWIDWNNTTGAPVEVILEVYVASGPGSDCNTYGLVLIGNDCKDGIPFCPGVPNSSGQPTILSGQLGSGSGSGLHLEAAGGPPGDFGYVIGGNQNAAPGIPLGNGRFCLVGTPGAAFYRFNVTGGALNSLGQFDAAGVLQNLVGTSMAGSGFDVPSTLPGGPSILVGSTWHFQLWHRDSLAGPGQSNWSNGLSVSF